MFSKEGKKPKDNKNDKRKKTAVKKKKKKAVKEEDSTDPSSSSSSSSDDDDDTDDSGEDDKKSKRKQKKKAKKERKKKKKVESSSESEDSDCSSAPSVSSIRTRDSHRTKLRKVKHFIEKYKELVRKINCGRNTLKDIHADIRDIEKRLNDEDFDKELRQLCKIRRKITRR